MEVIGGCAVALVILYGGSQVLAGTTTPGAFFSFVAALLFAYRPLKTLANLHTQVQLGLAAAERIYGLLDRPPAVRDQAGRAGRSSCGAARSASQHVRFAYARRAPGAARARRW